MSHIKSKILQMVPQDPRDEPASELLARIRTTREAAAAKKPATRKSVNKGKQS
jgi:type I restriction enzyme S subunit